MNLTTLNIYLVFPYLYRLLGAKHVFIRIENKFSDTGIFDVAINFYFLCISINCEKFHCRKMSEFERLSGVVATNIQKLVQNVSSMQRMIVHIDTQGDSLRQQLRQLQHYTGQLAKDTAQQLMNLGEVQVIRKAECS